MHLGSGVLHDTIAEFGIIKPPPKHQDFIDECIFGVLSVWNMDSWNDILGVLHSSNQRVVLITDALTIPNVPDDWMVIRAPLLMEPLFSDIETFQRSGILTFVSDMFQNGLSTIDSILSTFFEQGGYKPGEVCLQFDPISSDDVVQAVQEGLNRLGHRSALAQMLFADLDHDGSGYIEPNELLSMSHRFTNMDVNQFLSQLDGDEDGRIDVAEFDALLSDAMVAFVEKSIPTVKSHVVDESEAFDTLAALGVDDESCGKVIESHSQNITSGIKPSYSIADWVEQHASILLGVRLIPSVGLMRSRSVRIQGHPGLYSTLYRPDHNNIRLRRTHDGKVFSATVDDLNAETTVSWSKGKRRYTIELDSLQHIVRATSQGVWKDQGTVIKNMVEKVPLTTTAIEAFRLTGSFDDGDKSDVSGMLCRCIDLDTATMEALLSSGVDNLLTLKQQTGATTVCGGCTSVVEQIFQPSTSLTRRRVGTMDVPMVIADSFETAPSTAMLEEAEAFFIQMNAEGFGQAGRLDEVKKEIAETGSWTPTFDELSFGARLSWRNSTRCIGRFFWDSLEVRDARHLTNPDDIFDAMFDHIAWATNGGEIRACMTVFQGANKHGIGPRLWNDQYIRYACHELENGTLLGDPATRTLTKQIKSLGWTVEEPSAFDVLPIVLEWPGRPPVWREVPPELVLEVAIRHPDHPGLEEVGLKWYALPAVAAMSLEIGGLVYTLAPFNGFYMSTEIGARNFTDTSRYNLLEPIADAMGIARTSNRDLWKDAVQVELNRAILHSFETDGVRMMDHHTLSDYFLKFEADEHAAGREVFAEWAWIVPPIGASATPLYLCDHWQNTILKPNLFYLPEIHEPDATMGHGTPASDGASRCPFGHGSFQESNEDTSKVD